MSEIRKDAYEHFKTNVLPTWKLEDYINNLSTSHTAGEVIQMFKSNLDGLKELTLELEYNFIQGSDEKTVELVYLTFH